MLRASASAAVVVATVAIAGSAGAQAPGASAGGVAPFSGVWDFRSVERPAERGTPFELRQTGPTISGCLGTARLQGTVNGSIARATGVDPTGRPVAVTLVADDDGTIRGEWSQDGRELSARTAVEDPAVESPCAEDLSRPAACGSVVFLNFDVDSATIRPESYLALSDLYNRLLAAWRVRVAIIGHTSTEGTEDYNLALSERRAQAVVDDLVGRGYDPSTISATGRGESEPLIRRDDTESARSINRRVEIDCQR